MNGTVSATWALIPDGGASASRGTGYNYYDGNAWYNNVNSRIESVRTGFPSYVTTGTGRELVIAHSSSLANVSIYYRDTIGIGVWQPVILPGAYTVTWFKAAVGGFNGTNIHAIYIGSNIGDSLYYLNSYDNGNTWSAMMNVVPLINGTQPVCIGDSYAIGSKESKVAITKTKSWENLYLYKSLDSGTTFTQSVLGNFFPGGSYNPVGNISDFNGNGVADTFPSSSGDVCCVIDDLGVVHVAWGVAYHCDTNLTDFPYPIFESSSIGYINENMASPVYIDGVRDWNGNGKIDLKKDLDSACTQNDLPWGLYMNPFTCGFPSIAVKDTQVFLTFQAINELADTNFYGKSYYQIFATTSDDYGKTWPYNLYNVVTNSGYIDSSIVECVHASLAKEVDNNIYMVYQRDFAPGNSLASGDCDLQNNDPAANLNEIVVAFVPTIDLRVGASSLQDIGSKLQSLDIYPNPAANIINFNIPDELIGKATLEIYNTMGQLTNLDLLSAKNYSIAKLKEGMYYAVIRHKAISYKGKFIKN